MPSRRQRVDDAAQDEQSAGRQSRPPKLLVISPVRDWTCTGCGAQNGDLLVMENAGPLCLACADLDSLVFLPAGDAALTRRAKRAGALSAVVVRWSRSRRRYERQGILVADAALRQAEESCLADEDARHRQQGVTASAGPARTSSSPHGWPGRSGSCSRGARRGGPRRSPRTPRCGAAAGSGAARLVGPWRRAQSSARWSPRPGTRTRSTTRC